MVVAGVVLTGRAAPDAGRVCPARLGRSVLARHGSYGVSQLTDQPLCRRARHRYSDAGIGRVGRVDYKHKVLASGTVDRPEQPVRCRHCPLSRSNAWALPMTIWNRFLKGHTLREC